MARTLLQLVQDVCSDVGQPRPNVVVSSTSETPVRMFRLLNKAGLSLIKEVTWNELTTIRSFNAVAAQAQIEPPSDYSHMTPNTSLWDQTLKRPSVGPLSKDNWLNLLSNMTVGGDKYWTLINNKINIYPTPTTSDAFTYAYQSKNWVIDVDDNHLPAFTADTDEPLIDDELLALELVWRWKSAIGIDYAEDMANAGRRKELIISANRGPTILETSSPWQGELPDGFWPGVIRT